MTEFLALDWDDQQLVGVDAQVTANGVHVRHLVQFEWSDENRPSEHPEAAGKRLRAELDRSGIAATDVLVSLPREEAVVRLLDLPECGDDELPELVRFQAATRSAVPLDRLLLDFLPLPPLPTVAGRRVLLVTLGKPAADRLTSILSAAGLKATTIELSAVGTAEVVARQYPVRGGDTTLVVSRSGSRVEITAIWEHRILFMHAASVAAYLPPEAIVQQILAETSRATVALAQAAPGKRIDAGWLLGSAAELEGLAPAFHQRFGFEFQALPTPLGTTGVRADFSPTALPNGANVPAPVGLLLGQSGRLIAGIDFLHPRQKVVKADRRRLRQILAGAGALVAVIALFGGIHLRVARIDAAIAALQSRIDDRQRTLTKNAPLLDTTKSLEDWNRRDIDWLDQFRQMETAIGGTDKLHFTSFDGQVAYLKALATITASGRAKTRHDVEAMNERLAEMGYVQTAKEIPSDSADRQFPEKFELSVELVTRTRKALPAANSTASPAVPATAGSAAPAPAPADSKTAPTKRAEAK